MSAELAWYVGCPLLAAGLGLAAVRFTRSASAPISRAHDDEELPLQLAGRAPEPAEPPATARAEDAAAAVMAPSPSDDQLAAVSPQKKGALARVMRRGVQTVVRHPAHQPSADHRDVASADQLDDAACGPAPAGLAELAVDSSAPGAFARSDSAETDAHAPIVASSVTQYEPLGSETARGHGIVELEQPVGEEPAIDGPEWAARVAARETALAASLQAREDAERRAREDEDVAAALRHQEELERIAVAEQARVRAQARARRWFARLDADLDAPTVPERALLATTLGIRAPWAGKLLREAFAQEEEAQVRARILGALVAGDHLEVPEPFETGFARGGIERAAVWELLRPRYRDAEWIAELLAPLRDAMEAA